MDSGEEKMGLRGTRLVFHHHVQVVLRFGVLTLKQIQVTPRLQSVPVFWVLFERPVDDVFRVMGSTQRQIGLNQAGPGASILGVLACQASKLSQGTVTVPCCEQVRSVQ